MLVHIHIRSFMSCLLDFMKSVLIAPAMVVKTQLEDKNFVYMNWLSELTHCLSIDIVGGNNLEAYIR